MTLALKINDLDSVAVALETLSAGAAIPDCNVTLTDGIPRGHKFALCDIAEGETVTKYGATIGIATQKIGRGAHIHSHNMKTVLRDILDYAWSGGARTPAPAAQAPSIRAFVRANGDIGVRNDLWIIPLVGCVNGLARNIGRRLGAERVLPEGSRVQVLAHPYGCSQPGGDLADTRAILQNYALHPNAGGVLILGLGCENNTRAAFADGLAPADPERVRFLVAQDAHNEQEEGLAIARTLAERMGADRRVEVSAAPVARRPQVRRLRRPFRHHR